jgi:hypothetical protein
MKQEKKIFGAMCIGACSRINVGRMAVTQSPSTTTNRSVLRTAQMKVRRFAGIRLTMSTSQTREDESLSFFSDVRF